MTAGPNETYPARLTIDYPDRDLDRLSTLLRLIYVIPIAIVLGLVGGSAFGDKFSESGASIAATGGGVLVGPVLLMILFRQKYPRWWFDFHLQLARLSTRVTSYLVVRRGFDLVEGGSSAADFCDDLFGGLVPDEGLGVVVPVFGPDLDGIDEVGHAGEHASA